MTSTTTAAPEWATHYTRVALAALPTDLTMATPPVIDEAIRTLQLDHQRLAANVGDPVQDNVRRAIGQASTSVPQGHGRARRYVTEWPTTWSDALAAARALPADTPAADWKLVSYRNIATVGRALELWDDYVRTMYQITSRLAPLHSEFTRRGGWSRYYKVDNPTGHVHTTTLCRTTYNTTAWCWPTQLSATDGATVVEAAGPLTCLVCFPDQREDILANRPVRFDAFETTEQHDERVTREKATAARLAEKITKGVTPDGSPLVIRLDTGSRYVETVTLKTERAAELRYVEWAANATKRALRREYADEDRRAELTREIDGIVAARDQAAAALAAKRGITVEELVKTLAPKVARKVKTLY